MAGHGLKRTKNGRKSSNVEISNEFSTLRENFTIKASELEKLSDTFCHAIADLRECEELAHEQVGNSFKAMCDADFHRYKNAPIENKNLPPPFNIDRFHQKLNELKNAELEKKEREEEVIQLIEEKKHQNSELEQALRKKLEIIKNAKEFLTK